MPIIADWRAEKRKVANDLKTDVDNLRAAFVAFTAKFDTDATAQNAAVTASQLDTDYAATLDPVANSAETVTKK